MKHNKLVRDKIPEIIKQKGEIAITHIAANDEYWQKLKEKLQEEIEEFIKDDNNEEELADILEVIYAIGDFKNISQETLEVLRIKKRGIRGGFKDRIVLEETKE